jgi:hypothetical protein
MQSRSKAASPRPKVMTQTVLQAIQVIIGAAVGDTDLADLISFTQAQARLPIFPEVQTSDNKITVTAPATGTIRIPASVSILHRGIKIYSTALEDIATSPSKVYHLRWNPTDGFSLNDLADVAYNPTVAAETNAAFDSTYDNMLVSRIVTNVSNVATITNLANAAQLTGQYAKSSKEQQSGGTWSGLPSLTATTDWARTPRMISPVGYSVENTVNEESVVFMTSSRTRYATTAGVFGYIIGQTNAYAAYISGSLTLDIIA